MKKILLLALSFILVLIISGCSLQQTGEPMVTDKPSAPSFDTNHAGDEVNTVRVTLQTNFGDIIIELYPDEAPKTVDNFVTLAEQDFYDGVKFHRIIKDFIIQTGDPNSKDDDPSDDGTGGPGYTFEDEINNRRLIRGSVAMANRGADTNGSQFFIVTAPSTPWLDGHHTNFGTVIGGMDIVDVIEGLDTSERDYPLTPVIIENVRIEN